MAVLSLFRKQQRVLPKAVSISQLDFDKDEDIAAFVLNRWEKRDQHRAFREKQWFTNIAYYLGYQYHTYNDAKGVLELSPAPTFRVRLVCNRLMLISRKVVSKALRQRPTWVTIPATGEVEDQMTAIVGTKVLQYYWRYLVMDKSVVDLFTWMTTTGNVFLHPYWDASKGPELGMEDEEIEALPKKLQDIARRGVFLGDIAVDVCSPFEIDPDPNCLRIEDATHVIHTKTRSIEYLQDRYGDKAEGLTADAGDEDNLSMYYERKIQRIAGPFGFAGTRNADEDQASILTHTLEVAPTRRLPRGLVAVVAGGKVLSKTKLPPFNQTSYIHFKEIPVPGQFWGTCSLETCIPLQAEYNRGRSQLIENRNVMSKPKWLTPRGAGIKQTSLTSEPGERIEYNYPLKPEAWTPPPVPDYVPRLLEWALKDMEDISSIHEVTQARAPSGVRSGVAIAQLQEQDDQMLAPAFMLAEHGLARCGAWILQLLSHYVEEDRIVKVIGKDRQIESMVFSGKSLMGQNQGRPGINYFDVECQMGSQLPYSKLARAQFVIDLVRTGILHPINDRKRIFKALELGYDEPIINDEQLDRQQAMRENVQMLQGMEVEPNPWDNPMIHIEELRRFQKNPDFAMLAAQDPILVQIFERHVAKHALKMQAMLAPPPQQAPEQAQEPQPQPPLGIPGIFGEPEQEGGPPLPPEGT